MVHQSLSFPSKNPLNALVFDVGGVTMRAGYAGEDKPRLILPSAVSPSLSRDSAGRRHMLHCEAPSVATSAESKVIRLLECKLMSGGEGERLIMLEHLLEIGYKQLGVKPEEHPVLLSEAPWETPQMRQVVVKLLFEKLKVPTRTEQECAGALSRPRAGTARLFQTF